MKRRAVDWGICILFWTCVGLLAMRYTEGASCVAQQDKPLTKQLVEKLWR